MREDDGRKLSHKTLEEMRLRAVRQVQEGARPDDVAAALGLNRSTVFAWVAAFRSGGREALLAKPVLGRPPKLTAKQLGELYRIVAGSNPSQLEFEFELWTRDLVRQVIKRTFGVDMSVVSVGRWLRALGLSPQKPLHRAYQANPEAVEAWKKEQYPAIHARAKMEGATIYFLDEASVRSDYRTGTTWAPVGETPVVKATGARFSVNMISAIASVGQMRFAIVEGTLDAEKFIGFLRSLLHDTPGTVFLVVDGHPVHRSKAVKEFVASTEGRLELFQLPSYSPQLNPDEWVWKNIKHDRVGKRAVTGPDQLKQLAASALEALQAAPGKIRGFFGDPHLAYIRGAEVGLLST
jgi:transposase